jgi:hypothetical protein
MMDENSAIANGWNIGIIIQPVEIAASNYPSISSQRGGNIAFA